MVCTADAGSAYSIKVGEQVLQQIREEMERSYRPLEVSKPMERNKADEPPPIESAGLRSALSALYASYGLVGQLPPEPPTFRGRMGARLVKLVQRMLFWYTPQIVHFQYSALRALEEQNKILQRAERRIHLLEIELGDLKVASAARISNSPTDSPG